MTDDGGASDASSALRELAFDLRSSWNHAADALWEELDGLLGA